MKLVCLFQARSGVNREKRGSPAQTTKSATKKKNPQSKKPKQKSFFGGGGGGGDLGQIVGGEQHANGTFQHLGNHRAGVAAHSLDALGVEGGLRLAGGLVHEPHVPLLGGQHARLVHLQPAGISSQAASHQLKM